MCGLRSLAKGCRRTWPGTRGFAELGISPRPRDTLIDRRNSYNVDHIRRARSWHRKRSTGWMSAWPRVCVCNCAEVAFQSTNCELLDTQLFNHGPTSIVFVEYAKAEIEDILVRISVWMRRHCDAGTGLLVNIMSHWAQSRWCSSGNADTYSWRDNCSLTYQVGTEFRLRRRM